MITIRTLLHRLPVSGSLLYATVSGRRLKLADCDALIEIYEELKSLSMIGNPAAVKRYMLSLVLCGNLVLTREADDEFLGMVSCFDLQGDIQRPDGIFERTVLSGLSLVELEPDCWKFELTDHRTIKDLIRKFT